MYWPVKSSDLNPVEHAWYIFQRRVSERNLLHNSMQRWKRALFEKLGNINFVRRLIKDFAFHCRAVIAAHEVTQYFYVTLKILESSQGSLKSVSISPGVHITVWYTNCFCCCCFFVFFMVGGYYCSLLYFFHFCCRCCCFMVCFRFL